MQEANAPIPSGALRLPLSKSAGPLPKGMIMDCMKAVNAAEVKAPVKLGDILIENICGTGVNIVATNHCPCK